MLPWGIEYLGVLTAVEEELRALAPASVIDIGCGEGCLLSELSATGTWDLAGVEIDHRARGFARAFLPDRVFLHEATAGIPDGRFMAAVVMEVLEHIADHQVPSFLAEVRRVLAPDGALVLSVPTSNRAVNPKHHRHYTLALLQEQIEADFTIARVRWIHRLGLRSEALRRAIVNRFFVVEYRPWLRALTSHYRRRLLDAKANDAAHLLVVLRPRTGAP